MDSNIQQQIDGRISVLPEILQKLVTNSSWRSNIHILAERQGLNEEQKESLETEVYMVLAGLEPVSQFRTNLMRELGVSYDKALKISSDVNFNVFNPVMDILKGIEGDIKQIHLEEEGGGSDYATETVSVDAAGAEKILDSQFDNKEEPEILLPDHEQITKTDGPHMHSQNVMPAKPAAVSTLAPAPKPLSQPVRPAMTVAPVVSAIKPVVSADPAFKSIVDQKLSGMVRSSNVPANLPMSEKDLAEMMKKSEGVTMGGYKGIDPYREPIE